VTDVVRKALSLLSIFSVARPEIGLSDCARLAGYDKATTHRLLTTLCEEGLIEQHSDTRRYRLGAGILVLARIREASFPFATTAQTILEALSETTGETAHCSLYSKGTLTVIASVESRRANRVSMRGAEILPFHATASGIVFLAFATEDVTADAMALPMSAYTSHTCTDRDALFAQLETVRQAGYAIADRTYEEDVVGFAAPIFGPHQTAVGAVAVACPSHRWTQALQARLYEGVLDAALALSRASGNEPPKR
jgi:DNA-binding IclR family transcriptional regulator